MTPPKSFARRLDRESDGRLRIRWSDVKQEWHVEQKVGRAALPPYRAYDDSWVRACDGQLLVCTIRVGDRMPCPGCNATLKVPIRSFGEAICEQCKSKKRNHRFAAGCFELDDQLLEHLRKIDPLRDGIVRLQAELKLDDTRRKLAEDRLLHNHIEDVTKDNLNSLFDVAQVGQTGITFNADSKN